MLEDSPDIRSKRSRSGSNDTARLSFSKDDRESVEPMSIAPSLSQNNPLLHASP